MLVPQVLSLVTRGQRLIGAASPLPLMRQLQTPVKSQSKPSLGNPDKHECLQFNSGNSTDLPAFIVVKQLTRRSEGPAGLRARVPYLIAKKAFLHCR